ncbi:hypothetical protein [Streptomyces sp. NBC_00094]|uniref:hypothetical protein n=1 Tax=Streptomyces sp. NBC_00094 TaxID=2903620 RepID=UPI00225A813F|nr:hypothetical protein [Streptomyces sp. NBC_00094]MCX5390771.1 hypothetical protein [Streptomyces sp. NBC_00094]
MKFDVFHISASLVTVALTALSATACGASKPSYVSPKTVHHSELVGRWDGDQECESPLPFIRLRDDYTFVAKDYPIEWGGPGEQVKRTSAGGKWHAVINDPGLPPYVVLRFENRNGTELLTLTLEQGEMQMNGGVQADGGDPYVRSCHYKRSSIDPEFGR